MKILVCLKQVPHKDARLEASGSWIDEGGIKFEINQYDTYALEEALRIKDAGEGEVVVATIGPDRTSQALRTALGMGADRAIQIWDDALADADSLAIAKTLAAAVQGENFDLVLMGLMSDDTNYSLTGPMLAELLGWPHVSAITKLELSGDDFTAEREIEGATEVQQGSFPAVLTCEKGLNEPRYPSLKGIMQAKKKRLDLKTPEELGLDAAELEQPRLIWEAMELPAERGVGRLVEGPPEEAARELARLLREEAKVI